MNLGIRNWTLIQLTSFSIEYQKDIKKKLSTVITTNNPFSKEAHIFQEPVLTSALHDQLLHHCTDVNINGPSYRLIDQMQYLSEDN